MKLRFKSIPEYMRFRRVWRTLSSTGLRSGPEIECMAERLQWHLKCSLTGVPVCMTKFGTLVMPPADKEEIAAEKGAALF